VIVITLASESKVTQLESVVVEGNDDDDDNDNDDDDDDDESVASVEDRSSVDDDA
jgi:hypothetical protein